MKKRFSLVCILIPLNNIVVQAEEFTFRATGDASIYSFFEVDTSTFGLGLAADFSATGSQILVDGSEIGVTAQVEIPDKLNTYLFYKALFGTIKAGSTSLDVHDVVVPSIGDHANADTAQTSISNIEKQSFGGINTPEFTPVISYTSPKLTTANLELGTGFGVDAFDIAFASSFNAGSAIVRVGAGYAGNYSNPTEGNFSLGSNVKLDAFELGGKLTASKLASTSAELGGNVSKGAINFGVKYVVGDVTKLDKGIASAGLIYQKEDLSLGADLKLNQSVAANVNALSAKIGAKYKFGSVSVGTVGEYNIDDSTFAIDSGVDYELNSNITVGAGVSFNHDETVAGAAGVKVKF